MTLEQLLSEIAAKHGLRTFDMFARTRTKRVTNARAEFYFRSLNETSASSVEIGKVCAKDHSTVLEMAAAYAVRNKHPIPRGGWSKRVMHERAPA